MDKQRQQGDVLFYSVEEIPETAKEKKGKDIIVAEGESTGHAHRITDDYVQMFLDDGIVFLSSAKPFVCRHEEHKEVALPAGKYRIGIVREYDHFAERERRVAD
jgi:hypothetical protein